MFIVPVEPLYTVLLDADEAVPPEMVTVPAPELYTA